MVKNPLKGGLSQCKRAWEYRVNDSEPPGSYGPVTANTVIELFVIKTFCT